MAICDDDNVEHLTEDGGARPEALLRRADVAMYNAKAEGRGRYRFFSHAMNIRLHARLKLESEINGAIARSEIIPFYQPLVDLRSNYTVGYEALARWQHPELGLILPAEFISIAEDTGAIPDLTESLIRRGLNDAKQWRSDASISFNLSLRHFADAWLPQKLLAIVTEAGFPLRRLIFELTETSVVEKLDETRAAIQSLRNIGARVALDDFGVGYSGLQHLRELPLDIVKIDRSFVHRMTREPREINVVAAMIGMGHALGLEVAAEGIETRETLDALVGLGCDVGQGNLFGAARACAEVTPREHEELASRWIA